MWDEKESEEDIRHVRKIIYDIYHNLCFEWELKFTKYSKLILYLLVAK